MDYAMTTLKKLALAAACAAAFLPTAASAFDVIGLGFEGLSVPDDEGLIPSVRVSDFYDGGSSKSVADGTPAVGNGPAWGVVFNDVAQADTSIAKGGIGNFGPRWEEGTAQIPANELTDLGDGAMFLEGDIVLNLAPGFSNGFSFWYTNRQAGSGSVSVFSGLNGTGQVLGTFVLDVTTACALPDNSSCYWRVGAVELAGSERARSVVFSGRFEDTLFDNVTFGSTTPTTGVIGTPPIPEPGAAMLLALGLAGLALRARRRV
jgi:hypothetical protein